MKNFIKKYTTGVSFVIFLVSGAIIASFFIVLYSLRVYGYMNVDRLAHVNFNRIIYAVILSAIWLVASDVAKKRQLFSKTAHFILDSAFYLTVFGFIVYFTSGLHGGLFPIFYLAVIGSAMFSSVAELTGFLIVLSAETYAIYFLTEKTKDFYHFGVITLYVLFYFVIAAIIKYFYKTISEDEEKYRKLLELAKEAEAKAEINKEKYLDLIENTPLCIKVFDENMKMVFLNKGGREEHRIKDTDDISKWDWVGTVKEQYQEEAREKFRNAFAKGEASAIEFEHTPEGSNHEWCSSLISPIKSKDGKVRSVLFISNDITALKKAELQAKENERMFRALLDAVPLCVKWFDGKGNLISVNKGGREEHFLEKLSDEEIKNWDYWTCIEKEYRPIVKEKMDMALMGETGRFLMKHVPETSKGVWCDSALVPVKNEKGVVNYILFLSRDVTQEKLINDERNKNQEKAEETKLALFNILEDVKESEKNFHNERDRSQAIISSMGEGLFVVDRDYKIVLINNVAEKLFEISTAGALSKDIREIWSVFKGEEIVPNDERPINKTLKTGEVIHVGLEDDFYYRLPSGKKVPVEITTAPLKDNGITGVIVVFRDISGLKTLDEAKTSFISIASHQLRTPLTSIRWYSEMLDSEDAGPLNKDQKDFIARIYSGALKLNEVINMLLSLARIESGKAESELAKINIISFTQDILKELEPQINQKKLRIDFEPKEVVLPELNFDAAKLRQVITNLLSNAMRYTNIEGRIEIKISKDSGGIVYSVKDDGIGIPEKSKDKIFGKFFRAENAISKVPDGSGLGLSLVKALVEMWKGKVWFESPTTWVGEGGKEEKKGTVFYFTIPTNYE